MADLQITVDDLTLADRQVDAVDSLDVVGVGAAQVVDERLGPLEPLLEADRLEGHVTRLAGRPAVVLDVDTPRLGVGGRTLAR